MNFHIETESSEASKVLGGKGVHMDRHTGGLRKRVTPSWQSESLLRGISSRFPLTNHLALPGSESVFGLSQGPPLCVITSLSQDGF